MPTQPYVLPPTNVRPSAPAIVDENATKPAPHAIVLPPPPPDNPPAKPAATHMAKSTKPATKPITAATAPPVQTAPPAVSTAPRPMPLPTATTSAPTEPPTAQAPATQAPAGVAASAQAATTAPPGAPSDLGTATFGFYAGETRDQIIAAIGKDNILKQQGDILEVAAAPKPDLNFDSFLLIVGRDTGLVKLIASGKDIEGDPAGHQMKVAFTSMKTDLSKGYGDPSDNFDFLDVKATHRSPNQFMLSLTNNERSLAAYWTKKDFGNQISSISLSGNGLGDDTGYLSVEYEFAGYHAYLLAKK